MFSWLSSETNILKSGLLKGMTDVHAHLLPGVDDGMASVEESLAAIEYLHEIGVRRIFLTPHIMEDIIENHPDFLQKRFEEFCKKSKSPVELRLAGEYMLDTGFKKQTEEGLLTLGDHHVLVETSYLSAPPDLRHMLYELQVSGYKPIIAHPERYLYMREEELVALKKKGCKFQLNLMSLAGTYGKRVLQRSQVLLKAGFYDFAGSDLHHLEIYMDALSRIRLSRSQQQLVKTLIDNNNLLE